MKLVKLVAPADGFTFRGVDGKEYACDGKREVDVPESMVRELLAEGFERASLTELVVMQGPKGDRGEDGIGKEGDAGPQGKRGPIGPMPRHEWDGTELRFQLDTDQWGAWVDLQGQPGKDGKGSAAPSGIFGGGPIDLSGLVTSVNSYFPAGW